MAQELLHIKTTKIPYIRMQRALVEMRCTKEVGVKEELDKTISRCDHVEEVTTCFCLLRQVLQQIMWQFGGSL
jgi:hypothetical protein